MLALLSLTLAALCISTYAAIAARRTSGRSLSRQLAALSTRLEELDEQHQLLAAELNRQRSKWNMEKLRRKREQAESADQQTNGYGSPSQNGGDVESDKDEWTRQTNLAIARGEIRPLGRR
jgi:hypothetical protein